MLTDAALRQALTKAESLGVILFTLLSFLLPLLTSSFFYEFCHSRHPKVGLYLGHFRTRFHTYDCSGIAPDLSSC